ncbi:hypothetical protein K7H99_19625 [Providencia rettgeri]|uniref:hypothetical protein n=1 Tax=Providencia rettgeri TaxID=587 RepID=UPI001CA795A8|nr:hypothetical protein [Providencia rettgeri]QZY64361.1 hypothetical protein K7H99_19625 [Providencia rettgeri]
MNYKEILEKAVKSAQRTQNAKREIENVIEGLNISIQDFTDGKMGLVIATKQRSKKGVSNPLMQAAGSLFLNEQIENYNAICFHIISNDRYFELAEWGMNEQGYPCKISYSDKRDVYCSNKLELEQALGDLMNSPKAGEILLKMMKA